MALWAPAGTTALADTGEQRAKVAVPPPPAPDKAGEPTAEATIGEKSGPAGGADKAAATREALSSLYAGTTAAWFVEMRCRLLDKAERRAFEWHMGVLTRALQASGLADRELAGLQQLAQKDANDTARHDCGDDETRAFVVKGLKAVRLMVPKLTGLSYDPENAWLDRHTLIYTLVVTGLAIADFCPEFMADDVRSRFDGYRTDIERRAKVNHLSLAELRAQALQRTAAIKSCDDQARTAIAKATKLLSEFEE
ncbi:MAG: hypothetical protein D6757_02405 [Alphaproteobacteria bacterium]|nr:MAG: hypothetical protein D6757_02405 [Alphaproteobacteria bacterium]